MLSSFSHNLFLQSYFLKLQSQSLLHKRKKVKIYPQSLLHNMFSHVTWLWMRDMIVLLGIHLLQTLSGPSKPSCISIVGNYDCYLCLLGRYSSSTERVALNHSITPTTLYLISRFSLALWRAALLEVLKQKELDPQKYVSCISCWLALYPTYIRYF